MRKYVLTLTLTFLLAPCIATADSAPGERFREKIGIPGEEEMSKSSDWIFDMGPSLNVMFFSEDRNRPLAGLFFGARQADSPLHFRIGVEGANWDSGQEAIKTANGGADADTTFIRIPLAIEYAHEICDDMTLYIGPAYNFLIGNGDVLDDTGSGLSLGARVGYALTDKLQATLEGGYLWAGDLETDNNGGDAEFDAPYVSTGLAVTF